MGDLISSVIVIAVVGMVVLAIFIIQARKSGERQQAMKARGWELRTERRRGETLTLISGEQNGISWQMEIGRMADASSPETGSGYNTTMRWWTKAGALPEGMLLIGPRMNSPLPGLDFSGMLVKMLLEFTIRTLPGGEPGDSRYLEGARLLDEGSGAFRERFMLVGEDAMLADTIADAIESPLTGYALTIKGREHLPRLILWPKGLVMTFEYRTQKVTDLARIIDLGCQLSERVRSALMGES